MFCTKCGNKLNDGAKFCDRCGNPIDELNVIGKVEKSNIYSDLYNKKTAFNILSWIILIFTIFTPFYKIYSLEEYGFVGSGIFGDLDATFSLFDILKVISYIMEYFEYFDGENIFIALVIIFIVVIIPIILWIESLKYTIKFSKDILNKKGSKRLAHYSEMASLFNLLSIISVLSGIFICGLIFSVSDGKVLGIFKLIFTILELQNGLGWFISVLLFINIKFISKIYMKMVLNQK